MHRRIHFISGLPRSGSTRLSALWRQNPYDLIGEPAFAHDFEHVRFDDNGFHKRASAPGLHRVRPRVGAVERQTILPPDLFRRFENDMIWRDPQLDPRGMCIA